MTPKFDSPFLCTRAIRVMSSRYTDDGSERYAYRWHIIRFPVFISPNVSVAETPCIIGKSE